MNKRAIVFAMTSVALLASYPARAQDTSELEDLLAESVSTTASKSAQISTAVPGLSINVTAEDLRRYGVRTLGEAYNFLALGILSEDSLGEVEIGARGVLLTYDAGKHVLLLIDGHVTNDQRNGASFHSQAAGIPIELIDHIEIILGPGSVLYGSNAMLGVVNVVTKRAKDYAGGHFIVESGLSPPENRAHSPMSPQFNSSYLNDIGNYYRLGAGMGETFHLFGQPVEVTGQAEYYSFHGPTFKWGPKYVDDSLFGSRAPRGIWVGSTHDSYFEQTSSGYARLQSGDLALTLHAVSSHASSPYSRRQESQRDFDDPDSYQNRVYAAFDLSWNKIVSKATSLSARVYGDGSRDFSHLRSVNILGCLDVRDSPGCTRVSTGRGQWVGTELQASVAWLANLSMISTVGAEGRLRNVGFESGLRDIQSDAPTATFGQFEAFEKTGAIYAQQVYRPNSSVALNAGARWDIDDRFGHRVSPRVAASVGLWRGGTAKIIYSEAFRAPTAEELHFTHPYLSIASPDLSPETVRSVELVLQQRFGTERVVYGIYRSRWSDVVFRESLSPAEMGAAKRAYLLDTTTFNAFQYRNVAQLDDYGFNTGYEGSAFRGRMTYGANLTAAYSRLGSATGTQPLTVIPSIYGNARVAYDLGGPLPVVALASQFSNKRLADTRFTYASPTCDLRLTLSGQLLRSKGLLYRFTGAYAFTKSNPYEAGPVGANAGGVELVPVNRVTLMVGLHYVF